MLKGHRPPIVLACLAALLASVPVRTTFAAVRAATVAHGVAFTQTLNQETCTTGSFTVSADELPIVFVGNSATTDGGVLTDSLGGTYTEIVTATAQTGADKLWLYVRDALHNGGSTTLTMDVTGDPATGCVIFAMRVTGMTNVGAAAIRGTGTQSNQTTATPSGVLGAAALTGNPTIGFVFTNANPAALTPPTGWTEDAAGDTGYATPDRGGEYVYRDSGFTGTTITWNTSTGNFGTIVAELDSGGVSTPGCAGQFFFGGIGCNESLQPLFSRLRR